MAGNYSPMPAIFEQRAHASDALMELRVALGEQELDPPRPEEGTKVETTVIRRRKVDNDYDY